MRPVPNESNIIPGTLLAGKYRVIGELGRGGMAAVYEAELTSIGKRVAVKVLAQELAGSKIVTERFFREARAVASVTSPYIVDVYDSGRLEDGRPFIAMEMLVGESLYDRMARDRLIDVDTTVRTIVQCAKGLQKAHEAGIVHRDLKPENIFLTKDEDGREIAKILDFGLAKFYAPVESDAATKRLTREGAVFGTPAYMSPEQVKGQGSVDHRADLWALGCMAFECLIGRPVWNIDQGVAMTFAAIATAPIPLPSKLRPDLPTSFDDWFLKALERDPDRRFQQARELASALEAAFGVPSSAQMAVGNRPSGGRVVQDSDLSIGTPTTVFRPSRPGMSSSGASLVGVPAAHAGAQLPSDPDRPMSDPLRGAARMPGPSAVDLPPTARPSASASYPTQPAAPASPLRWAISVTALLASLATVVLVWSRVLQPQMSSPVIYSTATAAPPEPSVAVELDGYDASADGWEGMIAQGQQKVLDGDRQAAKTLFSKAKDDGGEAVAKTYLDQLEATNGEGGPCRQIAFSRPRLASAKQAGSPTVVAVERGAVVVWTDDREDPHRTHAYGVAIDQAGRRVSADRDLTPEATDVLRPQLVAAGDRSVLLYWDRRGSEAGVRVRWIDRDGRIAGPSVLVGASRPGNFWPSMTRAPDGYWVAWQDDRDHEGDDLFLRKLSAELEPTGSEIRATDYLAVRKRVANVRVPDIAVASDAVISVYKLERGATHTIQRMRVPLNSGALDTGLEERTAPVAKASSGLDRELGEVAVVNEDKQPADAPSVACGREGCFVSWHGEKGGAYAALLDPVHGGVVWRKQFAGKAGGHPILSVSEGGDVAAGYFEKSRVKMVKLSRDGVSEPSVVGRTYSAKRRPHLAAGRAKGEWYLAWQDVESGRQEIFVSRIACQ